MINNYDKFSKNKEFYNNVIKFFIDNDIEHTITSSDTQIKHGTVAITIRDKKLIDDVMKINNIQPSDFFHYNKYVIDEFSTDYIIYAIGNVKYPKASGVLIKNTDPEKIGNFIIKDYKKIFAFRLRSYLKPDKFLPVSKFKFNLEKSIKYFENEELATKFFQAGIDKVPLFFNDIYPSLRFLCFCANINNTRIKLLTGSSISKEIFRITLEINLFGNKYYFVISFMWSLSKDIKMSARSSIFFNTSSSENGIKDFANMLGSLYIPVYKILSKNPDSSFNEIKHDHRGTIAATNYGV